MLIDSALYYMLFHNKWFKDKDESLYTNGVCKFLFNIKLQKHCAYNCYINVVLCKLVSFKFTRQRNKNLEIRSRPKIARKRLGYFLNVFFTLLRQYFIIYLSSQDYSGFLLLLLKNRYYIVNVYVERTNYINIVR